jgi:hypothetical protein
MTLNNMTVDEMAVGVMIVHEMTLNNITVD